MDVLLVGAELEENLALRYLGASLRRAGHVPHYASFDDERDTARVVDVARKTRPDVVGLSMTFQFRAEEFGRLAQALRDAGCDAHITAGGHFPTFAFEEVLATFPAIDTVVRHEGEETLVELCAALARGRGRALSTVRGLAYRGEDGACACNAPRPLIEDLDALPFPDRVGDPQMHLGIPAAFLVGTRGCYGHCTFCCIHAYLKSAGGPMYRARSVENIADEMATLRRARGARMFVFHDDDFFTRDKARDLSRMRALRDALRARDVRDVALVVKARPDDVDPEVFDVLDQIGLLRVYLGVEAGSTQGLKVLGRGVDLAQNRRALDELRRRDVYTCFNMLAFDPESSIASLRETFAFLRAYAYVPMNFCRTEVYVGTPLMTKLAREGRLVGDVFGWDYMIRDPRAERAFRVFARTFLDRNFRCDGLMNATLGLGYHLQLLRQFYPRAASVTLRTLVDETTRRVNLDGIERMERILDFADSPHSSDPAAFVDFVGETKLEVERANRDLEARVADATQAIFRAAFPPRARPLKRGNVPVWQALSAAALALGPMEACTKTAPPPDPLPPPTMVDDTAAHPLPPPPDPLPMPFDASAPPSQVVDPLPPPVDASAAAKPDAGKKPAPTATRRPPPPPDPLPRPVTK